MRVWLRRLLTGFVLWRLLGPAHQPRFASGQRHPFRMPGRSVFVGDHEFFVRETGPEAAPVLLIIHGWGDDTIALFHRVIALLEDRFRIITMDNRNTGKSDRIRTRYEIADAAVDVAGVMDQLGIRHGVVLGYSMGGMIAQEFARLRPGFVDKLILSGTAAAAPHFLGIPPRWASAGSFLVRSFDRLGRSRVSEARTRYLMRAGAVEPQHALWYWTQHASHDSDLYWEAGAAISRFDARSWVGRLSVPSLVIITGRDQLMPPVAQYELAASLRDPAVIELHDARHEAPLTHSDRYAAAIIDFAWAGSSREEQPAGPPS